MPDDDETVTPPPGPSPQAESTQQATHPLDRRLLIAVAVIGLVGALIGGAISYLGVDATVDASREQNVEEFRRDERKQVYSEYLAQANIVSNKFEDALDLVYRPTGGTTPIDPQAIRDGDCPHSS